MSKYVILLVIWFLCGHKSFSNINPNTLLTRGKVVYTSSGTTTVLTNNQYKNSVWNVSNSSWWAVKLDAGISDIFLTWNCPAYPWSNELSPASCPNSVTFPINYQILVSNNSSNGLDGTWETRLLVTGNIVTARGHAIQVSGNTWIKMNISSGSGSIDEIEAFDISNGNTDTWFFPGTSISANTYKGTPPTNNFADLVHANHSGNYPAMIRGGIGCINSTDFVNNLTKYMLNADNVKYWAIEMGTNDAWGGSNGNVNTFKANLQTVINLCKTKGINPILAKVLATNAAASGWQVHSDFQKAINDLTASNNLIPGPDLYTWFLNHPSELNSDGVHPNAVGAASIQRLWAECIDGLYLVNSVGETNANHIQVYPNPNNGKFQIQSPFSDEVSVYGINGNLIHKINIIAGQNDVDLQLKSGIYFLIPTLPKNKKNVMKLVVTN
jgi:lysophospholipase L1-like esterase